MNILIISGSPRKGGNTELLAEAFAKGAAEHHHVEIVSVRDYKVNPCLGCNACFKTNGICAQKDDMAIIYEMMNQADMLDCLASLFLWYQRTVESRYRQVPQSNPRLVPHQEDGIVTRWLTEYNLCLKFFNIEDAGKVLVRGVKDKGDIKTTDALNEAYTLGLSI